MKIIGSLLYLVSYEAPVSYYLEDEPAPKVHITYQVCLSIVFEVGGGYQLPVLEFCPHALPWGGHMS